jgi:hypothetical protein
LEWLLSKGQKIMNVCEDVEKGVSHSLFMGMSVSTAIIENCTFLKRPEEGPQYNPVVPPVGYIQRK